MTKKEEFSIFLEQSKNKTEFMNFEVTIPFKISPENEEEFYKKLLESLKKKSEETNKL
jgi:hypothetical protein